MVKGNHVICEMSSRSLAVYYTTELGSDYWWWLEIMAQICNSTVVIGKGRRKLCR